MSISCFPPPVTCGGRIGGAASSPVDLLNRAPLGLDTDPQVRCQSVSSILNRPTPVDLVANLTTFPESAANVPEANLKTAFPEDSLLTGLPSFMTTDPV